MAVHESSRLDAPPSRRDDTIAIATCMLVSLVVYAVVLGGDKVFPNIDFQTHYRWLSQFQAALAEGTWYPRWMPLANLGLGELHYSPYPVYYYLASLAAITGIEPWAIMKMLALASNFLTGVIAYFGLRPLLGGKSAMTGAILLQLAPFPLFLFTHHAALPWQFSLPFATALVLLSLVPTTNNGSIRTLQLALTTAVLALTHVFVAFMTLLCLGLIKLAEAVRHPAQRSAFLIGWVVPIILGIGLISVHLLPAISARALLDPVTGSDPFYLNWRNSFAFPVLTSAIWGTRWFTPQWAMPGAALICLAAAAYILWLTRAQRGVVWQITAKTAVFSLLGLLFASEAAYPLYAYLRPFEMLQWPYRFVTVASLGAALTLALALGLCKQGSYTKGRVVGWLSAAAAITLLAGLEAQLLREGSSPNLSPALLQGEFRQKGAEFATTGPDWREYARAGGFEAVCRNAGVQCEAIHNGSQHRIWQVDTSQQQRLVLPLFAFPGWSVTLDGMQTPFSIDPSTGLVAVDVPGGQHRLEIEMRGLSSMHIGLPISVTSLIALLLLAWRRKS